MTDTHSPSAALYEIQRIDSLSFKIEDMNIIQLSTQVKISTTVLQVLILVFAGFATLLYQSYDADTSDLSKSSSLVLSWLFMSVGIIFIFPSYLLTLLLLAEEGGELVDILLFLLGGFITTPVLFLSAINLFTGFFGYGDINWGWYQQAIFILSSVSVFIVFGLTIYQIFCGDVLSLLPISP